LVEQQVFMQSTNPASENFLAARIDAAISRKQVASAFGARPLLRRNTGVLCQSRRGLAPAMLLHGGPKGRFALLECSDQP
jgi:hypothetical protein